MQASPCGPLSKTWCACAPAHASTHRSSGVGGVSPCLGASHWFQVCLLAQVAASEMAQKASAAGRETVAKARYPDILRKIIGMVHWESLRS